MDLADLKARRGAAACTVGREESAASVKTSICQPSCHLDFFQRIL